MTVTPSVSTPQAALCASVCKASLETDSHAQVSGGTRPSPMTSIERHEDTDHWQFDLFSKSFCANISYALLILCERNPPGSSGFSSQEDQ